MPGFSETNSEPDKPSNSRQHETFSPGGSSGASISKRAALMLLAVGVIGVLIVRRREKNRAIETRHTTSQTKPAGRDRAFIELNKQYLNLQYKMTQHKFSGDAPPDGLMKEILEIERKVHLISRALE